MSTSYEFDNVEHITVGTVGPVGQRVFYLQALEAGQTVTLKVEKQQVIALAQYFATLLTTLSIPEELPEDLPLQEPVEPAWTVGPIAVSYDEDNDKVMIVCEEMSTTDLEDLELVDKVQDVEELLSTESVEGVAVARFGLTRPQIAAFAIRGTAVVEAGRPPCPLCGYPLDPSGHTCPRTNGHRAPKL